MDFPGRFADRIMPDKIHSLSLSFLVDKLEKQYGGVAGNIAYTLKLLGVEPHIAACAGSDFDPYGRFLEDLGISTAFVKRYEGTPSSSYFVITDSDDNQIGSFFTGPMRHAKLLRLSRIRERVGGECFAVIGPTDPGAMVAHFRECKQAGIPYLFDPAFQIGVFTQGELLDGISGADIVIGNDYEIALLLDRAKLTEDRFRELVPVIVTTLGNKGSVIQTSNDAFHVPPAKVVTVVDPTGAGDAFRSGFLAGYLRKLPLPTAGRMGSVAAAYAVERYGTVNHAFTTEEFVARYRDNFGESLQF